MKTIYTPIAVSSGELPDTYLPNSDYSDMVFGYNLEEEIVCYYNFKTKEWYNKYGGKENVITWLKKEEVPELTEEEIEGKHFAHNLFMKNADVWDGKENEWVMTIDVFKKIISSLIATNSKKVEVKWEDNQK